MTINQALLAPEILQQSDLILTTHLHLVRRLPAFGALHLAPLPIRDRAVAGSALVASRSDEASGP